MLLAYDLDSEKGRCKTWVMVSAFYFVIEEQRGGDTKSCYILWLVEQCASQTTVILRIPLIDTINEDGIKRPANCCV